MTKFWGRGELFRQNCHRKYVISTGKPMALPTFELLIELVAKKLTELWRFKNLAHFLTWWPSSVTYLFVNVTYWNCSPIPYVDQVWWWYVKAFMSYTWQNWQTNRQTDRQTDRQMKGQSEIAYLPKFANMMPIVMVIVITEILYIILIFDCFENQ